MSAPNPSMPTSGWTVTGQVETTTIGTDNRLVNGITVSFLTGDGVSGSVFVPNDQYTPDRVRAAIAARAGLLDAVQSMTHESQ